MEDGAAEETAPRQTAEDERSDQKGVREAADASDEGPRGVCSVDGEVDVGGGVGVNNFLCLLSL